MKPIPTKLNSAPKQSFTAPRLTRLGTLRELTRTKIFTNGDSGMGNSMA